MQIKIIKPDGMFYEGESSFVEFTTVTGEMGVYDNHIPLTTILVPCVLKLHMADEVKKEIVAVAALMAGKVVASKVDVTIQDSLIDETLKEMGDSTWLS